MRTSLSCSVLSLVLVIAGCGGGGTPAVDGGPAIDAGMADASMLDGGAVDGGAVDGGAVDGGAVDGGAVDGGAVDGGAVDGGAVDAGPRDAGRPDARTAAMVTLTDFVAFGNCMPIVSPDPVRASWTATVSGAAGATATLTSATLTLAGARTIIQRVTVDAPVIALRGGAGSAMQRKVASDMVPTAGCGELCGGTTATIDLVFVIDGADVPATARTAYECAF